MTKRQRAALKLAIRALKAEAWAHYENGTKTVSKEIFEKQEKEYRETVAAMQTIEEMLRGEQGAMDI